MHNATDNSAPESMFDLGELVALVAQGRPLAEAAPLAGCSVASAGLIASSDAFKAFVAKVKKENG